MRWPRFRRQRGGEDVLITGMGFCLPSTGDTPTRTVPDFWDVVSSGRTCLATDLNFGHVPGASAVVGELAPEIPERQVARWSQVHHYGVVSMLTALEDARLDWRAGAGRTAAVITGRSGVDTIVAAYRAVLDSRPEDLSADEAKRLFLSLALSGTVTDITNVQASLLGSTGPTYTVSCGCASSAVALGQAADMIRSGTVSMAIVSGVDAWDLEQARLLDEVRRVMAPKVGTSSFAEPVLRMDRPMRPYDRRGDGFNMGDGAGTMILESRAHAEERGVIPRGVLLGQRTRRSAGHSALATAGLDQALVAAARDVMAAAPAREPGYVNGGAQGDVQFNEIESAAFSALFSEHAPVVSCQEASFGHVASALGIVGAGVCALAVDRECAPPTAGCEEPDPGLTFDPLPGKAPRFIPGLDTALSINYQVGGIASAMLIGAER